jgi:hypothetical protein
MPTALGGHANCHKTDMPTQSRGHGTAPRPVNATWLPIAHFTW